MAALNDPPDPLLKSIAVVIYEREVGFHSVDEVIAVMEHYGEGALWDGQVGPMLDTIEDALVDARREYRELHR